MHTYGTAGDPEDRRAANLAGALALAVGDRLRVDSDAAALVTLLERGRLTVEWLRRIVGLSHSATVRLVDRLAADGLVVRAPGPDRRSVRVELTAAGWHEAERIRCKRETTLASLLAQLSQSERSAFSCAAEKLLAAATEDRWGARSICRLCAHAVCAVAGCPVDEAATALGE
ncbi:MAG TPA: MarR family transcriptional regulator [Actinomycetes bacterium]|jgi:DNA-binding MarR family transcriptional regulator|nr:MarR family transcriptional regulator [Actinomycetes bacterium]